MRSVMGRSHKLQALADVALKLEQDEEELRDRPTLKLTPEREDALELWRSDPWEFLTGKDPDTGKPILWTVDQRDKANPYKPFPAHLDYLHYFVELLENEPYLCAEKCSQMIVTTTIALWSMWRTLTRPAHKVLLSKHKEDEAVTILREKIIEPWEHMPDWVRYQWPLRNKPSNRVDCKATKSHILGLPENAASADARGQTYQVGLIDEAEFQEMLPNLLTAMLPRASQVIWWSTPSEGGEGAQTFRDYLADHSIKKFPQLVRLKAKYAHVKGMSTRRNNDRNVTIVRIEHGADPAKRSQAWLDSIRPMFNSTAEFRREILIDRTSNIGAPYYPQFVEFPKRYVLPCTILLKNTPIVRGWDFGGRNPACIWAQWNKRDRRFWVLRELLGVDIDTYQFRDLVKYLSGQLSRDALKEHPRAEQMLEELSYNKAYPPAPWFEGGHKWLDFAGNEGVMTGRGLQRKEEAKTAAEILAIGDVILYSRQVLHSVRTEVINGLSRVRADGWPGLLIDPACSILWTGLISGLVRAKATPQNPTPSEPAPHSRYSHLHDALGYAITNMAQLEDADQFQMSLGPDGQILMPPGPDMQIASYLIGAA